MFSLIHGFWWDIGSFEHLLKWNHVRSAKGEKKHFLVELESALFFDSPKQQAMLKSLCHYCWSCNLNKSCYCPTANSTVSPYRQCQSRCDELCVHAYVCVVCPFAYINSGWRFSCNLNDYFPRICNCFPGIPRISHLASLLNLMLDPLNSTLHSVLLLRLWMEACISDWATRWTQKFICRCWFSTNIFATEQHCKRTLSHGN